MHMLNPAARRRSHTEADCTKPSKPSSQQFLKPGTADVPSAYYARKPIPPASISFNAVTHNNNTQIISGDSTLLKGNPETIIMGKKNTVL